MHSDGQTDAFLRALHLAPRCVDMEETARAFALEMERGLSGGPSSLMMLKTYLDAPRRDALSGSAAAIDIGGTYMRAVLAEVREGRAELKRQAKAFVPGLEGPVAKDAFFDAVARHLAPILEEGAALGVAFSHSAEILPNRDGRVLSLSKEIRVEDIEGAEVCRELRAALRRTGGPVPERCVLLNDTAAVALAAAAEVSEGDGIVGLVLGTGMNICYYDDTMGMFINTEAAGFDKFPRGRADQLVDEKSATPGQHLLEKAAAGRYLGDLVLSALRLAAGEGLLSQSCREGLEALPDLSARQVSGLLAGSAEGDVLRALCRDSDDERVVLAVAEAVVERAARLIAAAIAGVLLRKGATVERPGLVSFEGGTILGMHALRRRVEAHLERLAGTLGVACRTTSVEDAVIYGAALAALME